MGVMMYIEYLEIFMKVATYKRCLCKLVSRDPYHYQSLMYTYVY